MATSNRFAYDDKCEYLALTDTTVMFDSDQSEDMKYILGILNSKLAEYRYLNIAKLKSNDIYEYFWNGISKIPIKRIDRGIGRDTECHDNIVDMVSAIISLWKREENALSEVDRKGLRMQISRLERGIDQLVYELYGLTDKEIGIVEESVKR